MSATRYIVRRYDADCEGLGVVDGVYDTYRAARNHARRLNRREDTRYQYGDETGQWWRVSREGVDHRGEPQAGGQYTYDQDGRRVVRAGGA